MGVRGLGIVRGGGGVLPFTEAPVASDRLASLSSLPVVAGRFCSLAAPLAAPGCSLVVFGRRCWPLAAPWLSLVASAGLWWPLSGRSWSSLLASGRVCRRPWSLSLWIRHLTLAVDMKFVRKSDEDC